jgi:hypothetical protein
MQSLIAKMTLEVSRMDLTLTTSNNV